MSDARGDEVQNMVYNGVPITTLGEIFGLDHKEVNKRIVGRVPPVKNTNGDKTLRYRIRDAAPHLCDMQIDPEQMLETLKSLSPSKWPPALQDAFWKAQLSRQKYQAARNELWNTARVFDVISGAFKIIRLTILMFVDTVGQRTELTLEQRTILQELGDGLLQTLSKTLQEEFALYDPAPDEHGTPLSDESTVVAPPAEEEEDPFA